MHSEKTGDTLQTLNDSWENRPFKKRRQEAAVTMDGQGEGRDLGESEAEQFHTPKRTTHYSALWPIYLPDLSFLFVF